MAFLSARFRATLVRIVRHGVLTMLVLGMGLRAAEPTPAISAEYQVKAVFLFHFAQFAEWPGTAFARPDSPVVIGILGQDPFGAYLEELVRDEKIGVRSLIVRRCNDLAESKGCHLLFISRSEAPNVDHLLESLKAQSILTVSDIEGFARSGGMVQFAMEGGKVRLRINVTEAKSAGLTISSKILRPATMVTTGKN